MSNKRVNEMYRFHLYNSDEINKLKQELNTYKKIMKTIEADNMIEDLLKTKADYYDLTEKIIKLKGEMNIMEEYYQKKIVEYDKKEQNISTQIKRLDIALVQLREDVYKIKNKIDNLQVNELLEKINEVLLKQEQSDKAKDDVDGLKSDILRLGKEFNGYNSKSNKIEKQSNPRTSEFRQLQNMLQSTNYPELTQSKKKNKMTKNQTFQKRLITNQETYHTKKQHHDSPDTTSITKEKKYFSSQYGINKNIITRVTTSSNKKEEGNDSKEKAAVEEKYQALELDEHKDVQTEQTYEQKNSQRNDDHLLVSETKETEKIPTVNEEQKDDKEKLEEKQHQPNEDSKISSLFSIFKKR